MIQIELKDLNKRYGFQWIIRGLNATLENSAVYGITGRNGSGKSTLIKILSGYLSPTSGKLNYTIRNKQVPIENIYQHVSLAAPYTDLINEYTLAEMFAFHTKFKPFKSSMHYREFEETIQLKVSPDKKLSHYSSGMKQKIQIALAVLSDTPILLLDEPTSFLDIHAKKWFENIITQHRHNRLIVIASNDDFDLHLCNELLDMNTI